MSTVNGSFDLAKWSKVESPWVLAETAVRNLSRVFFYGPPGVGKTYLAFSAGAHPLSMTLSEDLSVQELMGHYVPGATQWSFHLGPVCQAFQDGRILILNEISRASGSVHDFLLAVLDHPDVARITLPSGETLLPGAGFKVIATSNGAPDRLDPALRSRFEAEVYLPLPHPHLLRTFDSEFPGLGKALADSFADPERALDPRRLMSFVKLIRDKSVDPRTAAGLAFSHQAPDVLAALSARGVMFS